MKTKRRVMTSRVIIPAESARLILRAAEQAGAAVLGLRAVVRDGELIVTSTFLQSPATIKHRLT